MGLLLLEVLQNLLDKPGLRFTSLLRRIVIRVQRVKRDIISSLLNLEILHLFFIPFEKMSQNLLVEVTENHLELGLLEILFKFELTRQIDNFRMDERVNVLE